MDYLKTLPFSVEVMLNAADEGMFTLGASLLIGLGLKDWKVKRLCAELNKKYCGERRHLFKDGRMIRKLLPKDIQYKLIF